MLVISYLFTLVFQSTLPVWGATGHMVLFRLVLLHFNPRSPCGERLVPDDDANQTGSFQSTLPVWGATFPLVRYVYQLHISIHAPRVGSD